jgi:uncharacterized damage-inducible protein DinB
MIQHLQEAFNETLNVLYDLPEDYLRQPCGRACARGGSARDLLVHNIFHEQQHTGQVWTVRDELRLLRGWGNASLYPLLVDYYLSRAQLINALFGLTDEQLDTPPPEGGWIVRQTIEHALGSGRRSISALRDEIRAQHPRQFRAWGLTFGSVFYARHETATLQCDEAKCIQRAANPAGKRATATDRSCPQSMRVASQR